MRSNERASVYAGENHFLEPREDLKCRSLVIWLAGSSILHCQFVNVFRLMGAEALSREYVRTPSHNKCSLPSSRQGSFMPVYQRHWTLSGLHIEQTWQIPLNRSTQVCRKSEHRSSSISTTGIRHKCCKTPRSTTLRTSLHHRAMYTQ